MYPSLWLVISESRNQIWRFLSNQICPCILSYWDSHILTTSLILGRGTHQTGKSRLSSIEIQTLSVQQEHLTCLGYLHFRDVLREVGACGDKGLSHNSNQIRSVTFKYVCSTCQLATCACLLSPCIVLIFWTHTTVETRSYEGYMLTMFTSLEAIKQ